MLRTIRSWIYTLRSKRHQEVVLAPSSGRTAWEPEIASLAGEDRVIDDAWQNMIGRGQR